MQYKIKVGNEECGFSAKQIEFLKKLLGFDTKNWGRAVYVNGQYLWPADMQNMNKLPCELIYLGKKPEKTTKIPKEENAPAPPKEEKPVEPPKEETQSAADEDDS